MQYEKHSFKNENVKLDGNQFLYCHFEKCTLVYGASGAVHLEGCSFDSCNWNLIDAALSTLQFLNFLWNTDGMKGVVDSAIDMIRSNPPHPLFQR